MCSPVIVENDHWINTPDVKDVNGGSAYRMTNGAKSCSPLRWFVLTNPSDADQRR